jgi:competence protein ComGC
MNLAATRTHGHDATLLMLMLMTLIVTSLLLLIIQMILLPTQKTADAGYARRCCC